MIDRRVCERCERYDPDSYAIMVAQTWRVPRRGTWGCWNNGYRAFLVEPGSPIPEMCEFFAEHFMAEAAEC